MESQRLNQSIHLLENTLNTPGKKLFRTSRYVAKTPRHSISREMYFQDTLDNLNESETLAPHELINIMAHNSLLQSPNLTFSESMLNGNTLKTVEKTQEILEKLFTEFYEITQLKESVVHVFQTVAEYIQSCTDNLDLVTNIQSKSLGETRESARKANVWLEEERNIWRLIYALYQDRLTSNDNPQIELIPPHILTEKQCVENLFKTDSLIRECQIVIDWLERNAADQGYDLARIGHFTDKTIGWENTFQQLTEGHSIVFPSTRPIVTKLDPDATFRENKPLHDLDIDDDKRLCQQIFCEIRCGRLDQAQALCVHTGHPWRAAMLEGWRLFHDPNYGNDNSSEKHPCEGNPNRDLWKANCWRLCENEKLDPYFRASLGALCGNLQPILNVCTSWSDYLWAYLKVMVDIKVESIIRDTILKKKYAPMPEAYWRNRFSLDEIFNKLPEAEKNHRTNVIYRFVVMDQPAELLEVMKDWVLGGEELEVIRRERDYNSEAQFLRMCAHIVLLFRELGLGGNEMSGDEVLLSYVQSLIDSNRNDFVAFYAALLPQTTQISVFAGFLEKIQDNSERKAMLYKAELASLDIEAITKHLVEIIRSKDTNICISDLTNEVTESDLIKISALDWLLFYETQRLEALNQTNALIRFFLASGKLDAARQAFNKIPVDGVELVLTSYDENSIPPHVQNTIKEFLCYRAYLEGNESFTEWFSHFHNAKPKPPAPLSEKAGFADKVAYEHRIAQYNIELDRWKLTMLHKTRNTKTILYNILLFPEGGWLVDANDECKDDCRNLQMKELRTMCIPKAVLLLHTVMHLNGEYKECIQLADLIADETKRLYEVFNKHSLNELLHKISDSSIALMDQKKDPWGYDVGT